MNKQTQEALKMAIERLEGLSYIEHPSIDLLADEISITINACKEALEAEQVCQAQELSITMQKDSLAEQHPELYRQNWNAKHPDMQQPAQEPVADVIQESITIDDFIKMQDFTVSEKATQPTITWPAGHGILVGNGFKFLAFKKMEVKEGVQLSIVGDSELHFTVKEPKQPAQDPAAFTNADEMQELKDGMSTCYMYKERLDADCIPLYTHPAQPWQGLTADELEDIKDNSKEGWYQLVCNVEKELKRKNHFNGEKNDN